MKPELRSLSAEEYQDLKVDHDGNIYWKGRKVRTGGWTLGERLSLAGLVVATVTALVAVLVAVKDIPEIRDTWRSLWAEPAAGGPGGNLR